MHPTLLLPLAGLLLLSTGPASGQEGLPGRPQGLGKKAPPAGSKTSDTSGASARLVTLFRGRLTRPLAAPLEATASSLSRTDMARLAKGLPAGVAGRLLGTKTDGMLVVVVAGQRGLRIFEALAREQDRVIDLAWEHPPWRKGSVEFVHVVGVRPIRRTETWTRWKVSFSSAALQRRSVTGNLRATADTLWLDAEEQSYLLVGVDPDVTSVLPEADQPNLQDGRFAQVDGLANQSRGRLLARELRLQVTSGSSAWTLRRTHMAGKLRPDRRLASDEGVTLQLVGSQRLPRGPASLQVFGWFAHDRVSGSQGTRFFVEKARPTSGPRRNFAGSLGP